MYKPLLCLRSQLQDMSLGFSPSRARHQTAPPGRTSLRFFSSSATLHQQHATLLSGLVPGGRSTLSQHAKPRLHDVPVEPYCRWGGVSITNRLVLISIAYPSFSSFILRCVIGRCIQDVNYVGEHLPPCWRPAAISIVPKRKQYLVVC